MDEKLAAIVREKLEVGPIDDEIGQILPAFRGDYIVIPAAGATQVQHQFVVPNLACQALEMVSIELAFSIVGCNTTAQMQTLRVGGQGGGGGLIVAGSQFDDMSAGQLVTAVEGGEIGGRALARSEIGLRHVGAIVQGRSDDLFDDALVQVDAGSKAHGGWPQVTR